MSTAAGDSLPTWLRGILRCPVGHHELVDEVDDDGRAVLVCAEDCGGVRRVYRIDDGIPVLLDHEAQTRV